MKLAYKLPLIVIGCSLVAALIVGLVSYDSASRALVNASTRSLVALREAREAEFKRYLDAIQGDVDILASNLEVRSALRSFSKAFADFGISKQRTETMLKRVYNAQSPSGDPAALSANPVAVIAAYNAIHDQFHPWFMLLQKVRGYYDIFLIDRNGDVVYSVAKEADFATNLFIGQWSKSGLAATLDGALSDPPNIDRQFVDFHAHAPSGSEPASFISSPIHEGAEVLGVLVFQMPIGRINDIMLVTAGMGETGETYVVGKELLMLTDSRFSDASTILTRRVNTPAVEAALTGERGVMRIDDYRGVPVLSAYAPIDFAGVRWAMLSEIDYDEVLAPVWQLGNFLLSIGIVIAGAIVAIGLLLARSITRPIAAVSGAFSEFGRTRQSAAVPYTGRGDEIGDMARNFGSLSAEIGGYVTSLSKKTDLLESLSAKLSKYLSPQVYRSIFAGDTDAIVATKRKRLTVLFSDLKDFTETTANLEPEDLTALLNRYFSEMNAIAIEYGATFDKFIGDAMLMFFGDPETRGVREDALQCVRMATAMQKRMTALQAEWRAAGNEKPFQMRIGINTGYCNVGNFGSHDRIDYTIIGGHVNLASRLEHEAPPDGIVVSADTYALVKDEFLAKELAPLTVKGIPRPVRAFELVIEAVQPATSTGRIIRTDPGVHLEVDLKTAERASLQAAIDALQVALSTRSG